MNEKYQSYQHNVQSIADALWVYFGPGEPIWEDPAAEASEKATYLAKADKLYKFYDSKEEVMKMLDFLKTVHPNFPKQLINTM